MHTIPDNRPIVRSGHGTLIPATRCPLLATRYFQS
jgi:hypothetical protein